MGIGPDIHFADWQALIPRRFKIYTDVCTDAMNSLP